MTEDVVLSRIILAAVCVLTSVNPPFFCWEEKLKPIQNYFPPKIQCPYNRKNRRGKSQRVALVRHATPDRSRTHEETATTS